MASSESLFDDDPDSSPSLSSHDLDADHAWVVEGILSGPGLKKDFFCSTRNPCCSVPISWLGRLSTETRPLTGRKTEAITGSLEIFPHIPSEPPRGRNSEPQSLGALKSFGTREKVS
ncbi:hypothetical protein AYI69_g7686 [Smittium culicis]|uniref:Uncharacterized protein n=1 Tax=Smittium culicis TaxID=133412 RepID=A0A1R1XQC6_9FUNG|nr:hypothetical protein AYI69_g7686 [Smittium culicis]